MSLYQVMDIKKQDVQLFLARPDLQVIHKFKDVSDRKLTVKFDDLHELTFSLPYKIDMNHQLIDNPAISLVRERFTVKVVLGQLEEYFVINNISKSASETNSLNVHCFHLPYELKYKRYRSYSATSYNCLQVTNDCLDSTPWNVGYIDPSFNVKYRQFDLSSGTRLDFLNQIGESFKAIKTYDTRNRLVNFYQESDISKYKGLNIKEGQYIDGISDEIDLDQLVTRLFVYGSEDLTINETSPNGQSYIEDFSYFLFPFATDESGNVIQHSHFMSDNLCKAIIAHAKLIEENQTTISGYFHDISVIQEEITSIQNIINTNKNQLTIVDDNIKIAKSQGLSTVEFNKQRSELVKDIDNKNKLIKVKNAQIDIIKKKINEAKDTLVLENYLESISQESLIDELQLYIIEEEYTDDNIIDATDLYNQGLSELSKRNSPPVNISINIIDFLSVIEESYNWNRLNIGDLVNIIHPSLNIKIQAKITQIDYDFENQSINLVISNGNRILNSFEQMAMDSYHNKKTSKDYQNRKVNWQKIAYNFDSRNDRISEIPADPSFSNNNTDITHEKNDDGSVTLTVNWQYPKDMTKNEYNIDGFNIYLYASKYEEEDITLGSLGGNNEIAIPNVSADKRQYTVPSVAANNYYYIGVQAYRHVDDDISSEGILLSEIVTSKHNASYPYQPEKTVNVQGKLNGVTYASSDVEPSDAEISDIWHDTVSNQTKIYTSNGWSTTDSGAISDGTNRYTAEDIKIIDESSIEIGKKLNWMDVREYEHLIPDKETLSNPEDWDWTEAIKQALIDGAGKEIKLPEGRLKFSETLVIPTGTKLIGVNTKDVWDDVTKGTTLVTSGTGNPQRWTDIDGTDNTMTPAIVLGGNEIVLDSITIECGSDRWDAAIFAPCVKRISMYNIDTVGQWKKAGLYLDATWSKRNVTLKNLHPEVNTSSGMNEFHAENCYFQGLWGVLVQGTTRNPADYTNDTDWLWGYGGTSDLSFISCRMGSDAPTSEKQVNGGSYKHDAKIKSSAESGQGHNFVNCSFRTGSKYMIYLDNSNRDTFVNCYGETIGSWNDAGYSNAEFAVTSNTGEISRINDKINAPVSLNGTIIYSSSNYTPYRSDFKMTTLRSSGHFYTPNFKGHGEGSSYATEIISFFDTVGNEGRIVFKYGKTDEILADIDKSRFNLGSIPIIQSDSGLNIQISIVSSAIAPNRSLFIDSTDGKLKFKDASGNVNLLY